MINKVIFEMKYNQWQKEFKYYEKTKRTKTKIVEMNLKNHN